MDQLFSIVRNGAHCCYFPFTELIRFTLFAHDRPCWPNGRNESLSLPQQVAIETRTFKNAVPLITQGLTGPKCAARKCLGTPGLASQPCSTGNECEPILK